MVEPSVAGARWQTGGHRSAAAGPAPVSAASSDCGECPACRVEPRVFQKGLPGKGIEKLGVELIQRRLIGRGYPGNGPEGGEIRLELRGRCRENLIEIGAGGSLVRA